MRDQPSSPPEFVPVDEIILPGQKPARGPARPRTQSAPTGSPGQTGTMGTTPRGLLSSVIAHLLDNLFRIPGTNKRVGLDPLFAIIPGLGGFASNTLGATILVESIKNGVPLWGIVRMMGNVLVNLGLDAVPVLGPFLTMWFKSNARNHEMLQHHIEGKGLKTRSTQSKVLTVMVVLFLLVTLTVNILVFVFVWKSFRAWWTGDA